MTEMTFIVENNKRKQQALMEAEDRLRREDELNDTYNSKNYNLTNKQAATMHSILTDDDGDYARSLLRKKKVKKPKPKRCRCKK